MRKFENARAESEVRDQKVDPRGRIHDNYSDESNRKANGSVLRRERIEINYSNDLDEKI
jgi:hypothetical protein